MDIIIKDSGHGLERKILVTDGRDRRPVEATELDNNPSQNQTIEYMNACRALFQAKQSLAEEKGER